MFVTLSSGDIRNGYTMRVLNKSHQKHSYVLSVEGLNDYQIRIEGVTEKSRDGLPLVRVDANALRSIKMYVATGRKNLVSGSDDIKLAVTEVDTGLKYDHKTTFKGPEK